MSTDPETAFRRWRRELELTQEAAAKALGVSRSQVVNWDAGEDRGRKGSPSVPPLAVRVLMAVLAKGLAVEPWPEHDVPVKRGRK